MSCSSAFFPSKGADFLTNVALHGIHNGMSYHSWEHCVILSFSTCVICNGIVYPFSAAVQCLNCRKRAHRLCCTKCSSDICSAFGLKLCSSDSTFITSATQINTSNVFIIEKTGLRKSWNSILADLRREFLYDNHRFHNWNSFNLKNVYRLEELCKSLLCDPSTFVGKTAVVCISIFMNLRFSRFEDLCIHGRYCLDMVSSAVVQEIEREYSIDADTMIVVSAVDQYIMSSCACKLYRRMMSACKLVTKFDDSKLVEVVCGNKHPDFLISGTRIEDHMSSYIMPLTIEVSALKKCTLLSKLLHQITDESIEEDDTSSVASMNHVYRIDADKLLPKVARVIEESLCCDPTINWQAECKYMISMCSERFLLGDEGYSLATIMQALKVVSRSRNY